MLNISAIEANGIKVRLVRNICKVKLPKVDNISDGITVIDAIHGIDKIKDTRVLENNFRTTSNGRVRLSRLKRDVTYTLVEPVDIAGYAVAVPKNKSVNIKGKTYNNKYMIVSIDGTMSAISKQLFKKMFRVEETTQQFAKRIGRTTRTTGKVSGAATGAVKTDTVQEMVNSAIREKHGINNVSLKKEEINENKKEDSHNNKIEIIARIVDINEKLQGYLATDENGKKYKISYGKAVKMAKAGIISNAVYECKGGKESIRGYAINLDTITKLYK